MGGASADPAPTLPVVESPALPRGFFLAGEGDRNRTRRGDGEPGRQREPEQGARDPASCLYLYPADHLTGAAARRGLDAGWALPLAGPDSGRAFSRLWVLLRDADSPGAGRRRVVRRSLTDPARLVAWAAEEGAAVARHVADRLRAMTAPRRPFAGLERPAGAPLLMGILNVTPDSFSDGGSFLDPDRAVAWGRRMRAAGAMILDVGGESTRPGATPLAPEDEIARVLPVVRALATDGAVVSIDTRHAATMVAALEAGARIVNDITGLTGDPAALSVVRRHRAPVVLMHMQGTPGTMQRNPTYDHAALDVFDWLAERIAACRAADLDPADLCVDPGIGFGKTAAHNLTLLEATDLLLGLGVEVLIGASRKSLIGHLTGAADPRDRVPGSVAVAVEAARRGAGILRVHDVGETRQALLVATAIAAATG